ICGSDCVVVVCIGDGEHAATAFEKREKVAGVEELNADWLSVRVEIDVDRFLDFDRLGRRSGGDLDIEQTVIGGVFESDHIVFPPIRIVVRTKASMPPGTGRSTYTTRRVFPALVTRSATIRPGGLVLGKVRVGATIVCSIWRRETSRSPNRC